METWQGVAWCALTVFAEMSASAQSHLRLLMPCMIRPIDCFTVVSLVAWPLNESETRVDLVLIETSLLFLC